MIYLSDAVRYACALYRDIEGNINTDINSSDLNKIINRIEVTVFIGNLISYELYGEPLYLNNMHQDIKGELLKEPYTPIYSIEIPEVDSEILINAYLDYRYADSNQLKSRIIKAFQLAKNGMDQDILLASDIDMTIKASDLI